MKKFINSVDTILKKGDYILIYPEQSMWWNYRKFPNDTISHKENIKFLKKKNFEVWKNIYEDFYGIPLKYTTINKDVFNE